MRVTLDSDNGVLTVNVYVEVDEPLSAGKALRGVMAMGYLTVARTVIVLVYCQDINKNISDFTLDLSTILTRHGLNRDNPLDLGLYVVPKEDIGLTALRLVTKGKHVKSDVIVITRNANINNMELCDIHPTVDNYIWINALTPDESITMEEIYIRHSLPSDVLTFVDVSNITEDDVSYLKKQAARMVFINSRCEYDYAISDTKAFATVLGYKCTAKLFLKHELNSEVILDTIKRVLNNKIVTDDNKSTPPGVSEGILTSEEDVHFTITIDKKGNKSLEIDFGKVANIISDISFVNDKLGCMKSVVKTTLSRMYPSYNWGVHTKDGKLVITGPGMKSATLVPGVDPSKQQIEYVLSRTVYFTMVLGRYLKGEIDSVDLDSGSADREKWYQNNIKYIMQ